MSRAKPEGTGGDKYLGLALLGTGVPDRSTPC